MLRAISDFDKCSKIRNAFFHRSVDWRCSRLHVLDHLWVVYISGRGKHGTIFYLEILLMLALCGKPNLRFGVGRVARFLKRQLQQLLRWMMLRASSEPELISNVFEHISYRSLYWRCSKVTLDVLEHFPSSICIWPWKSWKISHVQILLALALCRVRGGFRVESKGGIEFDIFFCLQGMYNLVGLLALLMNEDNKLEVEIRH